MVNMYKKYKTRSFVKRVTKCAANPRVVHRGSVLVRLTRLRKLAAVLILTHWALPRHDGNTEQGFGTLPPLYTDYLFKQRNKAAACYAPSMPRLQSVLKRLLLGTHGDTDILLNVFFFFLGPCGECVISEH